MTLEHKGKRLELDSPVVMGIINVTPDSFYAGSRKQEIADIVKQAGQMIEDGAALLDVGGYSTRPGAAEVPEGVESDRVECAIKAINDAFPEILISVDTFRQSVAEKAVAAGAWMINDVSGGSLDSEMSHYVASEKIPYCLMHMRGAPETMKSLTDYDDLLQDIYMYFEERLSWFEEKGHNQIIIDPGFGFAKTIAQNYTLLNNLAYFAPLKRPVLAGVSRKSMIYKTLGVSPSEALNGTTVLNAVALYHGAAVLRVHDVKEAKECITLMTKLRSGASL